MPLFFYNHLNTFFMFCIKQHLYLFLSQPDCSLSINNFCFIHLKILTYFIPSNTSFTILEYCTTKNAGMYKIIHSCTCKFYFISFTVIRCFYLFSTFPISYIKADTDFPLHHSQFFYTIQTLNAHKIPLPVDFAH